MYSETCYTVDSRDIDLWGACRPSAVMGMLQEAAVTAACALHLSREETMGKYGLFWMLARMWYRLDRPLRWGERITVRTWHRGSGGVSFYRDFDLLADGEPVGEAVSVWVLAHAQTHRLARPGDLAEFRDTDGGELRKTRTLSRFKLPPGLPEVERRQLHYSDTDVNGHVNNVRYADYIADAIRLDLLGKDQFVSELQVDYLAECMAGETIALTAGESEGRWYVRGAGPEGKSRFEGAVTLRPLDSEAPIK